MKVAIYARFSTDKQDPRSIEDQIRICEGVATLHKYEVIGTYRDVAVSGAHMNRAQMQALLAAVKQRGGPPFNAVIVDNQSRLSRDLGDIWNMIFGELLARQVVVIDCMTGMRSDQKNAKTFMGMTAVMDQAFLEKVAHETHRGLEGRAKAGFSAGGRVYGYDTEDEPDPINPEHPRKRIVINEDEAAVVRRIFALWLSGEGLKAIASR